MEEEIDETSRAGWFGGGADHAFFFATIICNILDPVFTGLFTTLQNLPYLQARSVSFRFDRYFIRLSCEMFKDGIERNHEANLSFAAKTARSLRRTTGMCAIPEVAPH